METKEGIAVSKIIFWLFFDSSKLFEKLQNESWYINPHTEWIDSFPIEKNQNVLEIGTGTGQLARYVQEKYACSVVAVDNSENMLRRAKKSKVTMINADATKLPFADKSFDFVMSSSLINIVSDPKGAITEMFRVSKRGALITLLVPNKNMTTENARRYIQKNNMRGFSKVALLFWARNARVFSKRELKEKVKLVGYHKSIQTKYFFDGMLVSFTLKKE